MAIFPALIAAALSCAHGQTLPPTQPTTPSTLAPTAISPAMPRRPQNAAASPAQRAQVEFVNGKLSINATNSSLNQILRDVSRLTGMRITGGVNDERVFGSYGPAEPAAILTTLLNGTGSNILIVENAQQTATELVLTPRLGGATPPNPNALRDQEGDRNDLPPQMTPRYSNQPAQQTFVPQPVDPGKTNPPTGAQAVPSPAILTAPATTVPAPADPDPSQQSGNGVKTPQQIYEQLMKLQQQQPKTPPLD